MFTSGPRLFDTPRGDPRRQAVAALRGYAYQLYASALAWVRLAAEERLFLEVAEDYAVLSREALEAVQVKDVTSAALTIRSSAVSESLDAFVDLVERNPTHPLRLRFLTTAPIGRELALEDRIDGGPALEYWRRAAAGAPIAPLRGVLLRLKLSAPTRKYIESRDDEALRADLLTRVHWDTGALDLQGLRKELEGAVLAWGDQFGGLTTEDARQATAALLERVLLTVLGDAPRSLSLLDLRTALEGVTHVWTPRRQLEALIGRAQAPGSPAFQRPQVLYDEDALPLPRLIADRDGLVRSITEKARREGLVFITGATGMGKTLLARLASRSMRQPWAIAEFRELDDAAAADRLDDILSALTLSPAHGVILDDLNVADQPKASAALARLRQALVRQDRLALVTTYHPPVSRLRSELGLTPDATEAVTHLTPQEVSNLVEQAGGDGERWGDLVYFAAAIGHPQLTQAVIADLQWRGWPKDELERLARLDTSGVDLAAQRAAARRRLIEAAPESTRSLLYRVSLLIGAFSRKLALDVAAAPPPVPAAGEHLDALTGPWLDRVSGERLRVSPLLSDAGAQVLSPSEQLEVHVRAANHILGRTTLDVQDASNGFLHALAGEAEQPLTALALAVVSAKSEDLAKLGEWLTTLRAARFDEPIFPQNATVSRLLRLAQVLLEAESERPSRLTEKWRALIQEIAEERDPHLRERFALMAMSKALLSPGMSQVPEWPEALARLDGLLQNPELDVPVVPLEGFQPVAFYFVNLAVSLKQVAQLRDLFARLDALGHVVRTRLLARLHARPEEISQVINSPWVAERQALDANQAIDSYASMAALAESWGERDIAIRCHVARSVMFDEYLDDEAKASEALNAAETVHGPDAVISRARAKIAFRRKRHGEALSLLRELAEASYGDPVERAFLCREAAISAAELGHEEEAHRWFEVARAAAEQTKSETLRPMIVGLRADAALSQWRNGQHSAALTALADTLDQAATIDPEASLKALYLHKALGHACLWVNGQASGTNYELEEGPTITPPGFCSNPEPSEGIRSLPRSSTEASFYLLAVADICEGDQAGLDARISQRIAGRHVFVLECSRRLARLRQVIHSSDGKRLSAALIDALEAMVLGVEVMKSGVMRADGLQFAAGDFPRLVAEERRTPRAEAFVNDVLFAVWLLAQLEGGSAEPLLATVSTSLAEGGYPLPSFLNEGDDSRQAAFVQVWRDLPTSDPTADQVFGTGLRMLEWAKTSIVGAAVLPDLGNWALRMWPPILASQRFRLRMPTVTVPAIEAALTRLCPEEDRLRTILGAARPAFHANLAPEMAALLALP